MNDSTALINETSAPTNETSATTASSPTGVAEAGGEAKRVEVKERQLLVDGKPVHLKGVAWNPVGKGGTQSSLDFAGFVEQDAKLMAEAGINAVRTYAPITDTAVLDALWARGIWVLNSVYSNGGSEASSVVEAVEAVKDHPALLMWTIGNEWNYNGLYVDMDFQASVDRLKEVAATIKEHDTSHPIACVYGELDGLKDADGQLTDVDVWGINAYRGISFGKLFDDYAAISGKPMFLGEYGADAFNAKTEAEDTESQAKATRELTEELVAHSSVSGGASIGGFVFEFADEWWKDSEGSPSEHDVGGTAPGGGPYPDGVFNEEWWGLVDIDRKPRPALAALGEVGLPTSEAS